MAWGALIGAAASLAGNYLSNKLQLSSNQDASIFNNEVFKDTQKYLALNSPSWQVKGLRDAGLNPILAVSQGLSSPQAINTASTFSPDASGINRAVQNAFNSASFRLLNQQAEKAKAETDVANQSARQIAEQTRSIKRDNDFYSDPQAQRMREAGKVMPYIGPVAELFRGVTDALSNSAKDWDNRKRSEARLLRRMTFEDR